MRRLRERERKTHMSDPPAEGWRELYRLALNEMNVPRRKELIDQTRLAIFDRMLDLCDLSDAHHVEDGDLEAALRELWKAENKESRDFAT
jgi:hypothetical protein